MVLTRFADFQIQRRALGYLTGRFLGSTWANDGPLISEKVLEQLVLERIEFTVPGCPAYAPKR